MTLPRLRALEPMSGGCSALFLGRLAALSGLVFTFAVALQAAVTLIVPACAR